MEKPVHYIEQYTNKWPSGLKTAEEFAPKVGLTPERLLFLADAGYCPHYKIDGGHSMFASAETRQWLANNVLNHNEGKPLPVEVKVYLKNEPANLDEVPETIRLNKHLIEVENHQVPSGVYFLCKDGEVVYVGQSVDVPSRVSSHRKDGKNFESVYMIPLPKEDLNSVEGALIRLLRPKLNGVYNNGLMQAPVENINEPDNLILKKFHLEAVNS